MEETPDKGITSPDEPTHEATTPPGNPEPDEAAVEQGKDKLEQAGGGDPGPGARAVSGGGGPGEGGEEGVGGKGVVLGVVCGVKKKKKHQVHKPKQCLA